MKRFFLLAVLRLVWFVLTVAIVVAIVGWDSLAGASIGAGLVTVLYIAIDWFTRPKPAQQWHVWDEELEADLSDTERDMLRKGLAVWPGYCSHGDTFDHGAVVSHRGSGEVAP